MLAEVTFDFPRTLWISLRHLVKQRLSNREIFLPVLNILVKGEIEEDPFEGGRRCLGARHEEILDASHQIEDIQLVPLFQFSEVNIDEVGRVLRVVKSLPILHLQGEVLCHVLNPIVSFPNREESCQGFRKAGIGKLREGHRNGRCGEEVGHQLDQLHVLFALRGQPLVRHNLPQDVDDRNIEVGAQKDVFLRRKAMFNHFFHLKMN